MAPQPPDPEDENTVDNLRLPPSSEPGSARVNQDSASTVNKEDYWRNMFELQNRTMMHLIDSVRGPTAPKITLPEFNPDIGDADARAWCSTVDICLKEKPLQEGALIITLIKALKGNASSWLSQVSYEGITWPYFKDLFLARYACTETVAATLIGINNGRPRDSECLAAYASRLMSSVMIRWKDVSTEEIALSYVLAHTAQFDTRVHRLPHTTELKTRSKLLQELKSFSSMKRKQPESVGTSDPKRFKYNMPVFTCHQCGKTGHKAIDCRQRKFSSVKPTATSTGSKPIAVNINTDMKKPIICFRCGEKGHISSRCTKAGSSSGSSGNNASSGAPQQQRRVDSCELRGVCGQLQQAGKDT